MSRERSGSPEALRVQRTLICGSSARRLKRLCGARRPRRMLRPRSLSTGHRISGLPMRANYRQFKTICEHTSDDSPTDFNDSTVNWWSSSHGVDTFVKLSSCFGRQLTTSVRTHLGITFHIVGPCRKYSGCPSVVIVRCSCGNSGFEHGSVLVNNMFACFAMSLITSQVDMINE